VDSPQAVGARGQQVVPWSEDDEHWVLVPVVAAVAK